MDSITSRLSPPQTPEKFNNSTRDGTNQAIGGGALGGRREIFNQGGIEGVDHDEEGIPNFKTEESVGSTSRLIDRVRHPATTAQPSTSNFPASSLSNSTRSNPSARIVSLPYNLQLNSSRISSPPPPFTSNGTFKSNQLASSSSSSPRMNGPSSQFLLTIVPPMHLPHDPPHPRTSPACSGYGPPENFRRGTLIPLYPTLSSQLTAIAREYGLPSTGGLVLYLVSTSDPNSSTSSALPGSNGFTGENGPRVGEEAWSMLWRKLFEGEEEEIVLLAETGESFSDDDDYEDARHAPPMPPLPDSYRNGGSPFLGSDGEVDRERTSFSSGTTGGEEEESIDMKGKGPANRSSPHSTKFGQGRNFPSGLPSPISRSTSSAATPGSRRANGFSSFSTASQPNLRNTASRQSYNSRSKPNHHHHRSPNNNNNNNNNSSPKPLGGLGYGAAIVVGRVEFDIDRSRAGRSKWYDNWVDGANELPSASNTSSIPSPSYQDFQQSQYGREEFTSASETTTTRSVYSSTSSPVVIPPFESVLEPTPMVEERAAVVIPVVKDLRALSLRDSATVFNNSKSHSIEPELEQEVAEEEEGGKAREIKVTTPSGIRGRRGAPEMRVRTASGTSQTIESTSLGDEASSDTSSVNGVEHDHDHEEGVNVASRSSSTSPSPLPPKGSPRLSDIQLSPENPYATLADSSEGEPDIEEVEEGKVMDEEEPSHYLSPPHEPNKVLEEKVMDEEEPTHYQSLPDESDRDLETEEESGSESTVEESTITLPVTSTESIEDVFPSDEATWRSIANEPISPTSDEVEHGHVEASMVETTGLGIVGARVEEMVGKGPEGVVENTRGVTNDEAGLPPPQDDVADVMALLQVQQPEKALASPVHLAPPSLSPPIQHQAATDTLPYLSEPSSLRPEEDVDSRFSVSRTSSSENDTDTPSPSTGHHNLSYRQGGSQWSRPEDLDSSTDHSTADHSTSSPARYSASLSEDLEEEERNVVGSLPPPLPLPAHMMEDKSIDSNRSSTISYMETFHDLERALEELSPRLNRVGDGSANRQPFAQAPPASLFGKSKSIVEPSSTLGTRPVFIYPTTNSNSNPNSNSNSNRTESNPYPRTTPRNHSLATSASAYTLHPDEESNDIGEEEVLVAPEVFSDNGSTPSGSPNMTSNDEAFTAPRPLPRTPRGPSFSPPSSRPMTSHPSLDDTSSRMLYAEINNNNSNNSARASSSRSSPQMPQREMPREEYGFEPPLVPTPPPRSPALSAFRKGRKSDSRKNSATEINDELKEKGSFFGKKVKGLFKKPDASPDMTSPSSSPARFTSDSAADRDFNYNNEESISNSRNFNTLSSSSSPSDQFLFAPLPSHGLRPSKSADHLRSSNSLPPLPAGAEHNDIFLNQDSHLLSSPRSEYIPSSTSPIMIQGNTFSAPSSPFNQRERNGGLPPPSGIPSRFGRQRPNQHLSADLENLLSQVNQINSETGGDENEGERLEKVDEGVSTLESSKSE